MFQGKHVLIAGSIASLRALQTFAPPISILVKAGAEDSIKLDTNNIVIISSI